MKSRKGLRVTCFFPCPKVATDSSDHELLIFQIRTFWNSNKTSFIFEWIPRSWGWGGVILLRSYFGISNQEFSSFILRFYLFFYLVFINEEKWVMKVNKEGKEQLFNIQKHLIIVFMVNMKQDTSTVFRMCSYSIIIGMYLFQNFCFFGVSHIIL